MGKYMNREEATCTANMDTFREYGFSRYLLGLVPPVVVCHFPETLVWSCFFCLSGTVCVFFLFFGDTRNTLHVLMWGYDPKIMGFPLRFAFAPHFVQEHQASNRTHIPQSFYPFQGILFGEPVFLFGS